MKWYYPTALVMIVCFLLPLSVGAGDWPQFRYDAGRTAASPHDLPADLKLRWSRELPTPRPAFPQEVLLGFDVTYEPVVLGGIMYVPSMVADNITALDTETGEVLWRFYAEGPVRFAPVGWEDKVYFVSDDGFLYCLQAEDGILLWKFRGLPGGITPEELIPHRRIMGNGRLISLWPARGGPVLADGVIYFAAGLWPTEGVFVHAVDANSGEPVWSNTESHHIPKSNWDHSIKSDAGLTPQGYLAIVGDLLVVPSGTQLPAFFDIETGELQTYTMGWGGRPGLPKGCWFVAGVGNYLSHGGDLYDITRPSDEHDPQDRTDTPPMMYPGGWTRVDIDPSNQRWLDSFRQPVLTSGAMYHEGGSGIVSRKLTNVELRERTDIPMFIIRNRPDTKYHDRMEGIFPQLWDLASTLQVHIKAGSRLYAGEAGEVNAIDLAGDEPKVVWRAEIEGTPHRMLAADGKLFVITAEGGIFVFAAGQPDEVTMHAQSGAPALPVDKWTEKAAAILEATGARDGYAVVLGIDSGRLVEELAQQSDLHLIALEKDADKVASLRERLYRAGLYGKRASVLVGDPVTYPLPPYLASLVVSEVPDALEQPDRRMLAETVFHILRPYGGVACIWGSLAYRSWIGEIIRDEEFAGASVRQGDDFTLLTREGPLPGTADWSHAGANAANTGASKDEFIRPPMSVLWFDASQRWHKWPEQVLVRVAGGRRVLLEEGQMSASDVFTGRKMWEVEVPFVGKLPLADPDARQAVREARNRLWGVVPSLSPETELVVIDDAIYVSKVTTYQLILAHGEQRSDGRSVLVFDPATGKQDGRIDLPDDLEAPWSNLRVSDDYLVGSSGAHVVCYHRHTGELLWRVEMARPALSLAVGDGKVFCAELTDRRHGEGSTRALDLSTGEELWQIEGGTDIRYSISLDILVNRVGFYRGADGALLTQFSDALPKEHTVKGPRLPEAGLLGFIAGQKLLTGTYATLLMYNIPSGIRIGEPLKWERRGCTGTRASTHLLTTRYLGNSAWIDLVTGAITPFFGVRPGCLENNNIFPANGVLNMPDMRGGCSCNYIPVSLGLVPAAVIGRGGVD